MEELRWNGNPVCPYCNTSEPYKLKDEKTYRCKSKHCKKDFTVTVGTIFDNTKLRLATWFAALYLVTETENGISSLQLSREVGITQKSAWFVLHRIRQIITDQQ